MILSPREGAKLIASQSKDIVIAEKGIIRLGNILVKQTASGKLSPNNFSDSEVHPEYDDPNAVDWIFVVDTLNFCFWKQPNSEDWKVEGHTGYYALCAAINRAVKEKVNILDPHFYSTITEVQLKKILRSDTRAEVPLLMERVKCLQEVGNVLLEKFEGSFRNVVAMSQHSAVKLLQLIIENFPCFRDEANFNGTRVGFYKRAQILVGDMWACFQNFVEIEEITAFADYRVPQTLLWYGVLHYSNELFQKLRNNTVLMNGERCEVEIRGCTIHAVELLKEYVLKKLGPGKVNSVLVDHFLWDFRRKHADEIRKKGLPFHKVYSIYY